MYSHGIKVVTKRFIKYAQSRNLKIMVWTINDEKTLKKLINLNVDGIITDKPKFLHQLLRMLMALLQTSQSFFNNFLETNF